ncbi:hypothetical protein OXB_0268 [Bacillus sp. OxB-1]|uniref:DUF4870 domain-containing protein n=1 Tax=Bacillus sp. (strain OxB-1) TaxID=98228 RepID=UPI000582114D|nr:DUF4870 domain-containing protein [Bacillus sp. OxB-1]BAQ08740.1 hypothetical protein OXB_0268 [Bacillus sp. OxB-1]
MTNQKLLSALCYFSIFFSPLLFPLIVYFISEDWDVKQHAKRSLVSHLVPTVLLVAGFVLFSFSMFSFYEPMNGSMGSFGFWQITPFLFVAVYGILFLVIVIWNIIQGVKVLK